MRVGKFGTYSQSVLVSDDRVVHLSKARPSRNIAVMLDRSRRGRSRVRPRTAIPRVNDERAAISAWTRRVRFRRVCFIRYAGSVARLRRVIAQRAKTPMAGLLLCPGVS